MPLSPADLQALAASAQRMGLSPREYGGLMSFESGINPSRWGGTGGRHLGLIQFGPSEQKQFGVNENQSFQEQLPAVENFLLSRGYQPGMGVAQAYSTINAGSPGRLGASDAKNGGTWGTVADKVNYQMGGHFDKVDKMFASAGIDPGAGASPTGPFGFGANAAPRTQAYAQIDPITREPLPDMAGGADPGANDVGDLANMLQAVGGAPAGTNPVAQAPAAGSDPSQAPPPAMSDAAPGMMQPGLPAIAQAQAQFDPSRFYGMLPRRGRRA